MVALFKEILSSSFYIGITILIVLSLQKTLLSKYTSKFNYSLCILILLRLIFIIKINIPAEFFNSFNSNYFNTYNKIQYAGNLVQQNSKNTIYFEASCCIWLIGIVAATIYYIYLYFKIYKGINNLKEEITDANIYSVLQIIKEDLNIKRDIKISKLEGTYSPMIVGIIRPEIIIPNRNYAYNDLNYIFRHELTHYKRKDNLLKLILTLATIIYWFNPIIYLFKNISLINAKYLVMN